MPEKQSLAQKFDAANLGQRLISALVLGPLVLGAIYLGGWVFALLATAIILAGLHEWLRLVCPSLGKDMVVAAYILMLAIMGAGFFEPIVGTYACLGAGLIYYIRARMVHKDQAAWLAASFPYLGGAGVSLLYLEADQGLLLFLIISVWGTDTGAYLAGRLIGGPKLCPSISPKKTWAGLLGGMALASLFGYLGAAFFGFDSPYQAAFLAAVLAVVSQVGDFFESYVKRRANVKDSGTMIPGHGGILDRVDGLLFGAVFFALYLAL